MICDVEPAGIRNGKEIVVGIARPGPAGQAATATLGIPASWGELEDALARARVTDDRVVYSVSVQETRMRRLEGHMPENVNLYEANYLAQRLAQLDEHARQLYEGMVEIEEMFGPTAEIPMARLIDMTAPENLALLQLIPADDDEALGVYACDHGHLAEIMAMPRAASGYFNYEKMGRDLRLKEHGVYLKDGGYVKLAGEIHQGYSLERCPRPEKPGWVFSLDVAIPRYATVRLDLPDHTEHFEKIAQMVLERGCAVPRFESILPTLSGHFDYDDDLRELNELAEAIRTLDARGELPKYRALVDTYIYPDLPEELYEVSWDAAEAIELARHVDEYAVQMAPVLPERLAADYLAEHYSIEKDDLLYPFIDLQTFGEWIVKASDHCYESAYGLVHRTDEGELWPADWQQNLSQ